MKKLCLMLVAVMLSSFLNVSAADTTKFDDKEEINVVYIGGSITLGSGASPEKSWSSLVGNWFTETYPGTTVYNYNAGIHGTGSELGYYRTKKDVIDRNPDVVFIEFAVNDSSKPEKEGNKLLEAIVNALQKSPTNPYIIFVYTTNETYNDVSEYQEKLAQYYGIPSIDLQTGVLEPYVAEGGAIRDLLSDGVHPNATGYQKYADYIISCLETGEYFKKAPAKDVTYVKSELGIEPFKFIMPEFTAAYDSSLVSATGNWVKGNHYAYGDYYKTTEVGATLEFNFSGPVLGMMTQRSNIGGQMKMELDGEELMTYDTYYSTASYIISNYDNKNLEDTDHTLKLTVLDTKNANCTSETPEVIIYGFFSSDGFLPSATEIGLVAEVDNENREVRVTNKTSVIDGEPFTIGVWYGSSADDVDFENDSFKEDIGGYMTDGKVGRSAVCIDQGTIQNGKIDYTINLLADAASGEYYVQVRNLYDDKILSTTFTFSNTGREDEAITKINTHTTGDMKTFLNDYLKDINVVKGVRYDTSFNDAQKDYVVDQLDGYSVYDDGTDEDFDSKLNNAFDKIDKLSELQDESKFEAAQEEIFADTTKYEIDPDVMTRYNALTQGLKDYAILYFREHVNEVVTPAGISDKFDEAVTAAENSPVDPPYHGPSYDGPSGIGNVTGGMSSVGIPLNPSVDSGEVFTDLGSVEWAKTAITTLAQKGVINGKGNQKFAPLDNVTREEYVKMIMVAFDIETEPANLKFEDVDENAWYYPYIAQAVKYGIINGISDTEFGTGKNITRQDAAVILSRAVEKDKYVEIYTVDANFKFNDIDKVSDYAAAAVEALGKAKIFSGKENDMFDPFGQATRAEAAMILYNLLYK